MRSTYILALLGLGLQSALSNDTVYLASGTLEDCQAPGPGYGSLPPPGERCMVDQPVKPDDRRWIKLPSLSEGEEPQNHCLVMSSEVDACPSADYPGPMEGQTMNFTLTTSSEGCLALPQAPGDGWRTFQLWVECNCYEFEQWRSTVVGVDA